MLRALWFLIKAAIVIAAAMWVLEIPGDVSLKVFDYNINMLTGHFLIALAAVIGVFAYLYRFWRAVVTAPKSFRQRQTIKHQEKGLSALTKGFVAVAAGDTSTAKKQARRAAKMLPAENGLSQLLLAQSALLRGNQEDADQIFKSLLNHKDAAFFGVRGLLNQAMNEGDTEKALFYAQTAQKMNPKQARIMETVYRLLLSRQEWKEAETALKKLEKLKAMSPEIIVSDRIALFHVYADRSAGIGDVIAARRYVERAYKINPLFVPSAVRHAQNMIAAGRQKKAIKIVEKAWVAMPHPELLALWKQLTPKKAMDDAVKNQKWFSRLVALQPENTLSLLGAAEAALAAQNWDQVDEYLQKAAHIMPSMGLYQLHARLAEERDGDMDAARAWLEKAAQTPEQEKWVCRDTGMVYDAWSPVAMPHNSFNTIEWRKPQEGSNAPAISGPANDGALPVLEAAV